MNDVLTPQSPAPPPASAPPPPPPPAAPYAAPVPVIVEKKSPGLAGFLSVFPGLGHVYLGLYQRGFVIGGAFILGISLTSHGRGPEFFGPMLGFLWFFGIIDAVRQAKAINRGQTVESGFAGAPQVRKAGEGTGALTFGVILIGLGVLWFLESQDLLDRFLDAIPGWGGPFTFILLGLALIVTHIRKKRRENEAGLGMPPRSA
ncbi:MAG: hypothetical protein ACRD3M_06480 [Thermoanaerobaculia bacterium]